MSHSHLRGQNFDMLSILLYMGLTIVAGFGLHFALYFMRRRRSERVSTPVASGRVIMYGIFVLVGIGFGLFGWNIAVSSQDEAADWSKADGEINVFQELDKAVIYDRGFSFSGDVTEPLHLVELTYDYTVDGQTYTGDKILSDEQLRDGFHEFEEAELEDYRDKYPAGKSVKVLYNPDDPSEAALETEDNAALLGLGIGAGVLFGLVTGVFALPIVQYWLNHPEADANESPFDLE